MDDRLRAPFDLESLVLVAGLAAGYASVSVPALAAMELSAGLGHRNPVGVLTRLTFRLVATHAGNPEGFAAVAQLSAAASAVRAQTLAAARSVLALACGQDRVPPGVHDLFLDEWAVHTSPEGWPDRLDGAFVALRATLATLSGRAVGNPDCAQLITSATVALPVWPAPR